eukprot:6457209-Karenia_brevis.AAC.1
MVAAVLFFTPNQTLFANPRIQQALHGARKLQPQASRLGRTEQVWTSTVGMAAQSLLIVVMVDMYLTPSEVSR